MLYQPAHARFGVDDPAVLLAEICPHLAATLVTHDETGFRATILPLLYDAAEGALGTLRGHWARGNPQWREIGPQTRGVAIFNGPQAYVSPSWYAEKQLTGKVVPTWNYMTVVAEGLLTVHHEPEWLAQHVGALVDRHEGQRPDPWALDDAPPAYIKSQLRAIVGLELRIERLEGKRKLSQNRSQADIDGTIAGLSQGGPMDQAVAEEMRG